MSLASLWQKRSRLVRPAPPVIHWWVTVWFFTAEDPNDFAEDEHFEPRGKEACLFYDDAKSEKWHARDWLEDVEAPLPMQDTITCPKCIELYIDL